MLQAGRAFEVRAWLEPDHQALLGYSPYHWLQAQAAAACGDYAAADAELDQLGLPGAGRYVRAPAALVVDWLERAVLALDQI